MTIEKQVRDALFTGTGTDTYFGAAPQGDDEAPSKMPVIIINRPDAEWPINFCGTDLGLAVTTLQVDYYAQGAEACRRLADQGREIVADLVDDAGGSICPGLTGEQSFYDQLSRAWRVMQTWRVDDYAPALPPLGP